MPELNMETVLSPAFCAIWDNSLMGVLIIDRKGLVRYINRLLIRTVDLQDETVLGRDRVRQGTVRPGHSPGISQGISAVHSCQLCGHPRPWTRGKSGRTCFIGWPWWCWKSPLYGSANLISRCCATIFFIFLLLL
ncbi:hypothetical protein [Desulfotignum phosphitoxidans]|uniref:PAS domain-containing protein n=1 Tax=Desulfotignum phosphitoxidans DSM 13687 TaxID=1286635 RepID=S0G175_9BACT|nr:hypothetical protein Dpo_15c00320 [Desulfotignum phosphitoxidans DSM 13687]